MAAATHLAGAVPELPVLWLGMAGFSPAQRAALEAFITQQAISARWRIAPFGDADAWWVNGARVSLMPGSTLKVTAGLPTEHVLRLDLKEVDRPIAFAKPLAAETLEARCTFDPLSRASIEAALLKFEKWLRALRAQFVLGALLIDRNSEERRGSYHLSCRGSLAAVIDFSEGQVALSPAASPADLWRARWDKRPYDPAQAPETFDRFSTTQVAWAYVRRTERNMLPSRYRTENIYYRRVPRVPLRWLADSQLMLLRELSAEPGTLHSLGQRTGLPVSQMEHDLACLYYAGSVTTTAESAAARLAADTQSNSSQSEANSLLDGAHRQSSDLTAPVFLEHKPPAD